MPAAWIIVSRDEYEVDEDSCETGVLTRHRSHGRIDIS